MKHELTPIEVDGYWVIGTNKWSVSICTKEQAVICNRTLNNCSCCINCSWCSWCSKCSDCSWCSRCSNCSGCSDCSGCSGCSGFKYNPERITSPIIGSRKSQTAYYWTKEHEQVVCGCFKGTLVEFEAKVKETHGNNEHGINYMNWINKVKAYKA